MLVYTRIQFQRRRIKRKTRRYKRIRVEKLIDSGGGKYRRPLPVWSTQKEEDTPSGINQSRADYLSELEDQLRGHMPEETKISGDAKDFAGVMVQDVCSRILTAARKSLETRTVAPAYRTPWFDEECRAAIDERRSLYKVRLRTKQSTDYVAYREALRRCRKLVKAKKVEYREERTRRLQQEADGSSRHFWRLVERELGSSKRSQNSPGAYKSQIAPWPCRPRSAVRPGLSIVRCSERHRKTCGLMPPSSRKLKVGLRDTCVNRGGTETPCWTGLFLVNK